MKKSIVILLVLSLAGIAFGHGRRGGTGGDRSINMSELKSDNAITITEKDNIATAMTKLAADSSMGTASETNQRTLFLSPGQYTLSAVVTGYNYCNIVGLGSPGDVVITLAASSDCNMITVSGCSYVRIENITFVCNGSLQGAATYDCIYGTGCDHIEVIDCRIIDPARDAIYILSSEDLTFRNLYIWHDVGTIAVSPEHGIRTVFSKRVIIENSYLRGSLQCITIYACLDVKVTDTVCEESGDDPMGVGCGGTQTATYTDSTRTLTKTGTFTAYAAGCKVWVYENPTASEGNITKGVYTIATVPSANAITLVEDIGSDDADGDIYVFGCTENMEVKGGRYDKSTGASGIHFFYCKNIRVNGVMFYNNYNSGLAVTNDCDAMVSNCTFYRNEKCGGYIDVADNTSWVNCLFDDNGMLTIAGLSYTEAESDYRITGVAGEFAECYAGRIVYVTESSGSEISDGEFTIDTVGTDYSYITLTADAGSASAGDISIRRSETDHVTWNTHKGFWGNTGANNGNHSFVGCIFTNNAEGAAFNGGTNYSFSGCQFIDNDRNGLLMTGGSLISITGCVAKGNGETDSEVEAGFKFNYCDDVTMTGCVSNYNMHGLIVRASTGTTDRFSVSNCEFNYNDTITTPGNGYGVQIQASTQHCKIMGCTILENTRGGMNNSQSGSDYIDIIDCDLNDATYVYGIIISGSGNADMIGSIRNCRIDAASDPNIITGDPVTIQFSGNNPDTPVLVNTANLTLYPWQNGLTVINTGDTGSQTITLPAANPLLEYSFVDVLNNETYDIAVTAAGTDEIIDTDGTTSMGAGDAIWLDNDAYTSVTLQCTRAGFWDVVQKTGTTHDID